GIERVAALNRVYRNEGVDSSHSPEFAMLAVDQAYTDYHGTAELTRALVQAAAFAVTWSHIVTLAGGSEFEPGAQWSRTTQFGSVSEALGEEVTPATPREKLVSYADRHELSVDPKWGAGKLAEELFEHLVA